MMPIEPSSAAGKKIYNSLRSEYLRRVRELAFYVSQDDLDNAAQLEESISNFLDDINGLSVHYSKVHRALAVLDRAGFI